MMAMWLGLSPDTKREVDKLIESFQAAGYAAQEAECIFANFLKAGRTAMLAEQQYYLVATPKQWHLYKHGKPRVRKKWESIFRRRYAMRRKRL